MKLRTLIPFVFGLVAFTVACTFSASLYAADVPLPPVADLEPQIDACVKDLEKTLEDARDDFAGNIETLQRDANSLVLLALALGMAPEDNQYKAAASEIIAAAQKMNQAKDLKTAQAVAADIKKSLTAKSEEKLEWKKVASMAPVMKLAVPRINTKSNTWTRNDKYLKRGVANVAAGTATLAVFSQGLLPNFDETAKPENKTDWDQLCTQFRDAAIKANQAVHDFDTGKIEFDAFKAIYDEMKASCDKCHEVFVAGGVKTE